MNMVPPELCDLLPNFSPEISAVVSKAIARDPNDRFDTAETFGMALESAAQTLGLVASYGDVARFLWREVGQELEKTRQVLRDLRKSGAVEKVDSSHERPTVSELSTNLESET